jgi:thioredoxin reductase (NADPH)
MATEHDARIVILGSGPAGWSAAIYAARAGLAPLVVRGPQAGGQLTITTDVENYPGYEDVIQGPWLMEQMEAQARHVGTAVIDDTIVGADLVGPPFVCTGDSGDRYRAEALVIATGASARWLGLPSEERFKGFGVSACATCDGFFFRGKQVVVIGGGNTAVEEALFLTNHASRVTLVHRRDALRADRILQERLMHNPKIDVMWNHVLDEVLGTDDPPGVKAVRLRGTIDGATVERAIDGVFIAIGHTPNTEVLRGQLRMDAEGYIVTDPGTTRTDVAGVFAAGDVQDKVYRQAVTAAGTGCMAALEAEKYLAHRAHGVRRAAE